MHLPPLPTQSELNNQFLEAAQRGDIAAISLLLKAPEIDINFKNRFGRTALLLAIQYKHIHIVKTLLAAGADINISQGAPLRMAMMHNDIATITLLFSIKDLLVNQLDREGYTALMYAAEKGELAVIRSILNAPRLDINLNIASRLTQETALMLAIRGGHIEVIKALIPFLSKEALNTSTNVFGQNALMIAVQEGKAKAVTALIPHLAPNGLNFVNRSGETALMIAVRNADLDSINVLLSCLDSASLSLKNQIGKTALILAIDRGFLPTILTLISALDTEALNIPDESGRTPLNRATQIGRLDIVEALIVKGANLHLKDNAQKSALDIASNLNHLNIAYRLLSEMSPHELAELQASDLGPLVRKFKTKMLNIQMDMYHTLRAFHHTPAFASLEGAISSVFQFDSKYNWYRHRLDRDISETIEKLNKRLKEKASTEQLRPPKAVVFSVKRPRVEAVNLCETPTSGVSDGRYPKRRTRSFRGSYKE